MLPGLINAHMHTWQTALRSVAANWTLLEYFRHVHAGLATVFVPEDIHIATLAGALNQLDHGVTTLVDWAHNNPTPEHTDAGIAGLKESGIRAAFFHGSPKPDPKPGEPHFSEVPHPRREIERLLKGPLADRNALVTLGMAVLGPHYSTLEVSAHDFALAKEMGLVASMHQGGGEAKTPGGWETLMAQGLVGPHINIVHGNNLTDAQLKAFVDLGVELLDHAGERDGAGPRPSHHRPAARAGLGAVGRRRSRIGDQRRHVHRGAHGARLAARARQCGGTRPQRRHPGDLDRARFRGARLDHHPRGGDAGHGRPHRQPGARQAGRHRGDVARPARHVAGARCRGLGRHAGLGRPGARRAGGRHASPSATAGCLRSDLGAVRAKLAASGERILAHLDIKSVSRQVAAQ